MKWKEMIFKKAFYKYQSLKNGIFVFAFSPQLIFVKRMKKKKKKDAAPQFLLQVLWGLFLSALYI